ncbi:MAG: PD40 domain-containing protein [Bacteroidetes bacterium]|nr:PD40 domain-containing protein [Bacteroidota bacterium]
MKKMVGFFSVLLFSTVLLAQEKHLSNLRKLTYGGDNAEAYFSPDGKSLVFQSNFKKWGLACDQIFNMDIRSAIADSNYQPPRISNGLGRTTCSYFMPNGQDIIFASTFKGGESCPHETHIPGKYLWSIYDSYDIFVANQDGELLHQLTNHKGYDAEATVSPKGDKIVFTSTRSGDLELWTMDIDGSNQTQITNALGYDGGAFFSPDGTKLVYRASRPNTDSAKKEYLDYLAKGLVAPTNMEIYTCNVDGSDARQITQLGKANWAPFFHPSGNKIIFSSNHHAEKGYNFQLWMINLDGSGLEQITTESMFNAFPMFSPDGKHLVFSSNRNNGGNRDTNVYIADWVE